MRPRSPRRFQVHLRVFLACLPPKLSTGPTTPRTESPPQTTSVQNGLTVSRGESRPLKEAQDPAGGRGGGGTGEGRARPPCPRSIPRQELSSLPTPADSQPCSDEEGCSEVFLPTDSDYDSSDALSPRDLDLVYLSSHDIAQQALSGLSGSAPDVLQVHDVKSAAGLGQDAQGQVPGSDPDHAACAEFLHGLSLTGLGPKNHAKMAAAGARPPPLGFLGKRKPAKRQHYGGFSRHHRWLRMRSETQSLSLSEGVYTPHLAGACDLAAQQQPGEAGRPRALALTHAASLPEGRQSLLQDPRPSLHRIYVEPYPEALVDMDAKSWASLRPPPGGPSRLPSPTRPERSPEAPTTSQVSEILSSML